MSRAIELRSPFTFPAKSRIKFLPKAQEYAALGGVIARKARCHAREVKRSALTALDAAWERHDPGTFYVNSAPSGHGVVCRAEFNGERIWGRWDRRRRMIHIHRRCYETIAYIDDDTSDAQIVRIIQRLGRVRSVA
jgi:hypothetical protein